MTRTRWLETQAGWQRDRDAHGALCPKDWNLRQLRAETAEEEIEALERERFWASDDEIGMIERQLEQLRAGELTVIPERDPADAWNRNEARLTEDRVRAWLSTEEQRAKRSKLAKRKLQAKGIRT